MYAAYTASGKSKKLINLSLTDNISWWMYLSVFSVESLLAVASFTNKV